LLAADDPADQPSLRLADVIDFPAFYLAVAGLLA